MKQIRCVEIHSQLEKHHVASQVPTCLTAGPGLSSVCFVFQSTSTSNKFSAVKNSGGEGKKKSAKWHNSFEKYGPLQSLVKAVNKQFPVLQDCCVFG